MMSFLLFFIVSLPPQPSPCCEPVDGGWECNYRCPPEWWVTVIHLDNFERCYHRVCPDPFYGLTVCEIPRQQVNPFCWWSKVVGYDATLIFKDGFESGVTARWERSVP